MIRPILATAAALALVATPVSAQQHQHGQQPQPTARQQAGGMGGMMMHMMHEHGVTPGLMLGASQALGLTAAQVQELEAIQARAREEHDRHMSARTAARSRAQEMMGSHPVPLDDYRAALQEAANHQVMAHVAMTRSAVEARAALTPEQQQRLDAAVALMHQMMPGQGMGGMGMGGGMGPGGGR